MVKITKYIIVVQLVHFFILYGFFMSQPNITLKYTIGEQQLYQSVMDTCKLNHSQQNPYLNYQILKWMLHWLESILFQQKVSMQSTVFNIRIQNKY